MKIEWAKYLQDDVYIRLCECRNVRKDIYPMAEVLVKHYNYDCESAYELVLEWIGDWNGQFNVTDLTKEQHERIVNKLQKCVDK